MNCWCEACKSEKRSSRSQLSHSTSHELILHLINLNQTVLPMKNKATALRSMFRSNRLRVSLRPSLSCRRTPYSHSIFLMRVFILTLIMVASWCRGSGLIHDRRKIAWKTQRCVLHKLVIFLSFHTISGRDFFKL